MKKTFRLGVGMLVLATIAAAQTKTYDWVEPARPGIPSLKLSDYLDEKSGALRRTQAKELINALGSSIEGTSTVAACKPAGLRPLEDCDKKELLKRAVLIHSLVWKSATRQPAIAPNKPVLGLDIDKEHWYVYTASGVTDADFETAQRLAGVQNTGLLYIHLNVPKGLSYRSSYHLKAAKKLPLYWQHLAALLGLFGVKTDSGGAVTDQSPNWRWNFTVIGSAEDPLPVPSDLTLKAEYQVDSWKANDETVVAPPEDTTLASSKESKFDNEGLYYVDFSVGVPLKKIRDVKYTASGNTLAPSDVDKQNIYAFLNIYTRPVDLKNELGTRWLPHPVLGVKIGSQPLKKVILAAGIGPPIANFYAGILLNTKALSEGSTCKTAAPAVAGESLKSKTCPEFAIGLNLSVGAIVKAFKK